MGPRAGSLILNTLSGSQDWMDYPVPLKRCTLELLRPGRNVIAADVRAERGHLFDMTLDAFLKAAK